MLVCYIQVGRNKAWAGFTALPKHAWLGITALVTLSSWQALAIGGSGYIQRLADDNVVVRNESEMYKIQSIEWRDVRVLSGLLITVGYWEVIHLHALRAAYLSRKPTVQCLLAADNEHLAFFFSHSTQTKSFSSRGKDLRSCITHR